MTISPEENRGTGRVVWDPVVRVFHWALAASVIGGWLLGEFGPLQMTWHFYLGYATAALIAVRLVWGFVGTETARFSSFLYGPKAMIGYLNSLPARKPSHWHGHNPMGALSVFALLAVLMAQIGTGLIADPEDYINIGPLADQISTEWNRWALAMHHTLSKVLLALVVLHVGTIFFYKFWKREDLVTPMITGKRKD